MPSAPQATAGLSDWLDYISSVNPREIELGLDRVAQVWQRMGACKPAPRVITVAGTNGKGSCVAALEALLLSQNKSVGCYTSPHLHHFSERIRLGGQPVSDSQICAAFALIDHAREDVLLSYFEFSTLAALHLFKEAAVDFAVLEVGLGGRLDAVNIIDADVAIITSISLDHVDWLGSDLADIAREKAGIMRSDTPVICADRSVPQAIEAAAQACGAIGYFLDRNFFVQVDETQACWRFEGLGADGGELSFADIPLTDLKPENLAAALQALLLLNCPELSPRTVFAELEVAGRLQWCRHSESGRRLLLDVAHNVAAVTNLGSRLQKYRAANPGSRIAVVLAVMADKDVESMISALQTGVDIWYIAQVDQARCMPAVEVAQIALESGIAQKLINVGQAVPLALERALAETSDKDLIVVTGSFFTVAELAGLTSSLRE